MQKLVNKQEKLEHKNKLSKENELQEYRQMEGSEVTKDLQKYQKAQVEKATDKNNNVKCLRRRQRTIIVSKYRDKIQKQETLKKNGNN